MGTIRITYRHAGSVSTYELDTKVWADTQAQVAEVLKGFTKVPPQHPTPAA